MSTVYFSHGDKGGTGKSMTSLVLIDYLLAQDKKVSLIEGDKGQPDVAIRVEDFIHSLSAVNLNLAGAAESAIMTFAEKLSEMSDSDAIVVNLPSAAGDTLDSLSDLIIGAIEDLGMDIKVFYSMGTGSTATAGLLRSTEEGIIAALPSLSNACVILPEFLGIPSTFDYSKNQARAGLLKKGLKEANMPALLPAELLVKAGSHKGTFTFLTTKESPLLFSERMMLSKRWLPKAHDCIAKGV
jgi:hypothetical protein